MVALMEGKIEEAPTILVEAAPPPTPVEIEAFFLRYIFMNSSQLMLDGIKLSDEEKKYLSNYLEIMIDIMRNKRKSNKKLSEGDMPW